MGLMRKLIFLNSDTHRAQGEPYFYKCGFHTAIILAPVAVFLIFHLVVNLSILFGPEAYQNAVEGIHWLDTVEMLLPVELMVIFFPLISHMIWGFLVNREKWRYPFRNPYLPGVLYPWQRISGMLALFFVLFHLWQLHRVGKFFTGGFFDHDADLPHAAAQTLAAAITSSTASTLVLFIGILAGVFHATNGVRLAWITKEDRPPEEVRKINRRAFVAGAGLCLMGLISLCLFVNLDVGK